MPTRKDDRLFNPNGRKHFRRTYSLVEVRYSLLVLAILAGIGVWVGWRGAHPDPELLALESDLLDEGTAEAPERARKLATGTTGSAAGERERGPVPPGLAAPGWREAGVATFERDNLYVKINGRAGYYESFGVVRLHFVTLVSEQDEARAVDIEMYDMGKVANALGAYAGERQPETAPELEDGTLGHTARNAMFLVRGRFYVRAIGADESQAVMDQLAHLRRALAGGIESEALPWAYGLFVAAGTDPGKIGFQPENAFSFGFARNVYTVAIDDEGAELFTVATESDGAARALAEQFTEGFLSYGEDAGQVDGITWIEDQYLGTLAAATTRGSLVVGVRGAPDQATAGAALADLARAAEALPEDVRARAAAETASPPAPSGGYGEDPEPAYDEPGAEPVEPAYDEPGAEPVEPAYDDEPVEPSYDDEPGAEPSYDDEPGAEPGYPEEYAP